MTKITVNPPSEINQVTGEEVAVPDSERVEVTGKPVVNSYAHGEADNLAFQPLDRQPVLRHRAFQADATEQDIRDYWTNGVPPTDDEMLHIQGEYTRTNDEQLARFLTYKATGNTEQLNPEDFEALGIQEPTEQVVSEHHLSNEEIDHEILSTDDSNDYSPQWAEAIAKAPLGETPEMIAVKHLMAQVYEGQLSRQAAFAKAAETGIAPEKLYASYNRVREYFGGGQLDR